MPWLAPRRPTLRAPDSSYRDAAKFERAHPGVVRAHFGYQALLAKLGGDGSGK